VGFFKKKSEANSLNAKLEDDGSKGALKIFLSPFAEAD